MSKLDAYLSHNDVDSITCHEVRGNCISNGMVISEDVLNVTVFAGGFFSSIYRTSGSCKKQ